MTREGFDQSKLAKVEAAEMLKHAPQIEEHHLHSTGRGGRANITELPEPLDAKEAHHSEAGAHMHSSGRGGAGNIRPNHPPTAADDDGERGREPHGSKNVLHQVWDKVRAASSSRTRTDAHAQAVATTHSLVSGDGK